MAFHAVGPLGVAHRTFLADGMVRGIFQNGAGGLAVGREIAQHVGDLARRADVDDAVALAGGNRPLRALRARDAILCILVIGRNKDNYT